MTVRTVTLTAPAGAKQGVLHTQYGVYQIAPNGSVTVDSRLTKTLMRQGYTNAALPDLSDDTHLATTVTLAVPAGVGEISANGVKYPIVTGHVTVPRDLVASLVNEGLVL